MRRSNEQDSETDRQMAGIQMRHQSQLRREEELGYARGLLDAKTDMLDQPEGGPRAWLYKDEPYFDGAKWNDKARLTESKQLAFWKDKNPVPLYIQPPATRKPITAGTPKIYTVFDKDGDPAVSFLSLADCHQHISEAVMNDIPDAAGCYIRAMYPEPYQPLQPITADDVTDEMCAETGDDKEHIAIIVNAYLTLEKP